MILAKPCPSLPIIWKLFWLVGGLYSCYDDEWGRVLQVLFKPFSKSPGGSPMYSSSQVRSQYCTPPPGFGRGIWMTVYKQDFLQHINSEHTLTVYALIAKHAHLLQL